MRKEVEVEGVIREVEEVKGWIIVHLDGVDKPVAFPPHVKEQLPPKGSRIRGTVKEGYKWYFALPSGWEVVERAEGKPAEAPQPKAAETPRATEAPKAPAGELKMLPVEEVSGNPFLGIAGVERTLDKEFLESVKRKGIVEPVIVREHNGVYELVAGHRRLQAAKAAGIREIPAVVRQLDDREAAELLLVENLHRRGFSPVEEAKLYRAMIDILGYTETSIAHKVGRSRERIAQLLMLLDLPEKVQEMIHYGQLTERHGRALHRLAKHNPEKAVEVAEKAAVEQWTAARLEEEVDRILEEDVGESKPEESATRAEGVTRVTLSAEEDDYTPSIESATSAEEEGVSQTSVQEAYTKQQEVSESIHGAGQGETPSQEELEEQFYRERAEAAAEAVSRLARAAESLLRREQDFNLASRYFGGCDRCPAREQCMQLKELLGRLPQCLRKVVYGA